ncbi:hypothetical protein HG66A1_42060 [Gimesia chilikensis]|uniref:Tox-PL domain-containing protein n=1 Tax=Gimesia chilikensis TaxID=2605989 RepID=A0A517PSP7_9PLAN|nr:hypothetical protein HG66A1_42060 [Gimesia chilikensis]
MRGFIRLWDTKAPKCLNKQYNLNPAPTISGELHSNRAGYCVNISLIGLRVNLDYGNKVRGWGEEEWDTFFENKGTIVDAGDFLPDNVTNAGQLKTLCYEDATSEQMLPAGEAFCLAGEMIVAVQPGPSGPGKIPSKLPGTRKCPTPVGSGAAGSRKFHSHGHGHSLREINVVGGNKNCGSCAIATDLSLGGKAASAINIRNVRKIRWQDFPKFTGRNWYGAKPGRIGQVLSINQIKRLVQKPGARGIVGGLRVGKTGHYFNVVNQNGTIRFIDGQTGKAANLNGYIGFLFMSTR